MLRFKFSTLLTALVMLTMALVACTTSAFAQDLPPVPGPPDASYSISWVVSVIVFVVSLIVSWVPTSNPNYDIVHVIWKVLTTVIKTIWPNSKKPDPSVITRDVPPKRNFFGRLIH